MHIYDLSIYRTDEGDIEVAQSGPDFDAPSIVRLSPEQVPMFCKALKDEADIENLESEQFIKDLEHRVLELERERMIAGREQ